MSLTILQTPNLISPSFNNIHYLVESQYGDSENFRYKYDIHTKDGIVNTKYVLPYPGKYGKIDISKMLIPYMSFDFNPTISGSVSTNNSIIQYDTYIGYSSIIYNKSSDETGRRYVINATDENFNVDDFIMIGNGRFLTNTPKTINVYKNDYYTLNYLNGNFGDYISYAAKLAVSQNGSVSYVNLSDYEFTPNSGLTSVGEMVKIVGVGPKNLNITSGDYSIWLTNSDNIRTSEVINFKIKEYSKYGYKQVAFLNRLGGFSYFTFIGKSYKELSVERHNYLKNVYGLNNDSWTKDEKLGMITNYDTKVETEYTFNSDYIDQSTFDFMEELFTSPMVYLIDDEPIQIIISDTDWFNKKKVYDKSISFSVKAIDANNKKVKL